MVSPLQFPDTERDRRQGEGGGLSPYVAFPRHEWARLRGDVPQTLTEADLEALRGVSVHISLDEVEQVYLPLARLLQLYVGAAQSLYRATDTFLGNRAAKVPYIIGIAGSVAAGKSTTARILQALLRQWFGPDNVALVTTDGFLYPNRELEARGLLRRKGFPESYDQQGLVRFVYDIKSGKPETRAPVYSHLIYDIVPGEQQVIGQPDVLIIEGLNVLQTVATKRHTPSLFVSDFFDFSIYLDADETLLRQWFLQRFLRLRETAFRDRSSYFHRYTELSEQEAIAFAELIWDEINLVNLRENILPTRDRARLILGKGESHAVEHIHLRKL